MNMTSGALRLPRAFKIGCIGCCLLFSSLLQAEPAPWYLWHSKTGGFAVCRQQFPGEGWVRQQGPFKKAQCGKYLKELKMSSSRWQIEAGTKPK